MRAGGFCFETSVSATPAEDTERRQGFVQDERECSFRPEASGASLVLAASAATAGLLAETIVERAHRLAVADAHRVAAARAAAGEEYYSQFTFQPEINSRSKRLYRVRLPWSIAAVRTSTG